MPTRRRTGLLAAIAGVGFFLFGPADAFGQQLRLLTGRAPHRVGQPFVIGVEAKNVGTDAPELRFNDVPGLAVRSTGRPDVRQFSRVVNRRVAMQTEFTFKYLVLASKPGSYSVGPFRTEFGGKTIETNTIELQIEDASRDPSLEVKAILPDRPVVLGERAPFAIEFSLPAESDVTRSLQAGTGLYVYAPIFDRTDIAEFDEVEPEEGREYIAVQLVLPNGMERVAAAVTSVERGGSRRYVFRIERLLVPRTVGKHDVAPTLVSFEKATRWQRSFLGSEPSSRVWLHNLDVTRTLEVVGLPPKAPESFAGAIGESFDVEVTADRSVLKAGEPIRLQVVVRGDGDLETTGLGSLSADGGLSPDDFHLPPSRPAGVVQEDGSKLFEVIVRPRHERVRSIPAIAYSWFDPGVGRYETTRSQPISLSVSKATIVSADDIQGPEPRRGATPSGDTPDGANPTSGESSQRTERRDTPSRAAYADLSVETDPSALLATSGTSGSRSLLIALYGVPWLLLIAAWFIRRQASVDPRSRAFEALRQSAVKTMNAQRRASMRTGLETVANELRRVWREAGTGPRDEVETFLGECDDLAFAPESREEGRTVPDDRVDRAIDLARRLDWKPNRNDGGAR